MIAVSFSLPGNVQHRIGVPSLVTAIAMTTWGRSVRKSLECPKARFACSVGLAWRAPCPELWGFAVNCVRPAEVVDHLRHRGPRVRMPLVVRELQVGHHRPVPVRPPRFSQVHAYTKSRECAPCRATRRESCAYTISLIPHPLKPLTRPNTLRKPRICLRTAEVRTNSQVKRSRLLA